MFRYILRRILLFIPTLLVISFAIFGLSQLNQGNPVRFFCATDDGVNYDSPEAEEAACRQVAANMGLDKAPFYFSLTAQAFPDTLHQIFDEDKKDALIHLVNQYGNWNYIAVYHQKITALKKQIYTVANSIPKAQRLSLLSATNYLLINHKDTKIASYLEQLNQIDIQDSAIQALLNTKISETQTAYLAVKNNPNRSSLYIPSLRWYGFDNQYHRWITNFFKGDFGLSYRDRRPVSTRIWEAVKWTLIINIISIFLVFVIAVPLGVRAAANKDSHFDKISSITLFLLYSLPTFWVATLCLVFITTPEFGMNWFPTNGLGNLGNSAPFWSRFWETAYHLILPILCVSYGSFAFVSRQVRGGMLNEIQQDYIRTARAKGVANKNVIWRHGFRNALFPIITLIASVLPATIGGSFIVEIIFGLPGMGRLAFNAIFQNDWPIVYTIIMLSAILTLLGTLLADMLYAMADPRVSFSEKV